MLKRFLDDSLRRYCVKLLAKHKLALKRIDELTADNQRLTRSLNIAEAEIDKLRSELDRALSTSATQRREVENLQGRLEIYEARIELLSSVVLRDRERVLAETAFYVQLKEGQASPLANPSSAAMKMLTQQ